MNLRRITAISLTGVLALAACGGDDSADSGSPTTTASDASADESSEAPTTTADDSTAAAWAAGNGCPDAEPVTTAISETVDRLDYGCEVELYRVNGGGHTWPGSTFDTAIEDIAGAVDLTLPANEVLWAFFQDHPLTG